LSGERVKVRGHANIIFTPQQVNWTSRSAVANPRPARDIADLRLSPLAQRRAPR
jgi:hypothetical protein